MPVPWYPESKHKVDYTFPYTDMVFLALVPKDCPT